MGRKPVVLCLLIFAVLNVRALGGDEVVWRDSQNDRFVSPRGQLSLSIGLRTDASPEVNAQPEVSLKYLRWFSHSTAITADLDFANETAFSYRSTARTFALGVGLRLQEPGEIVSVFLEPGLSLVRHRGDLDGTAFTDTRPGISLTLGASFSVHRGSQIDVSLRQVINEVGSRPFYASTPTLPPPPDQSGYWMGGADAYDLYNTTHLVLAYRFSL